MTDTSAARSNVNDQRLARRASALAVTLPASHSGGRTISFDSGHAFNGVLPDLTKEAERALSRYRSETLQYANKLGLPDLRKRIGEIMAAEGITVRSDELLVTNGAKHAIELACRVLLDEGDSIVVTSPTYFTAIPIFRSFGVRFIEIAQDDEGMVVDELAQILETLYKEGKKLPKFIYNVPDFHNPTGLTMSLARRRQLVALAARFEVWILEDSPYRNVRFEGEPVPLLKSLDTSGVVIHIGTFSKLMAPGLRVGWAAAPQEMIARMAQLKSDGGSCPLTQRIIVEFLAAGRLDTHISQVQATYKQNRDLMAEALRRDLPEAAFNLPQGGYYIWVTLPPDADGDAIGAALLHRGVSLIPGSKFFARADADHPRNHVRLAFSHAVAREIDDGVRSLAEVCHSSMGVARAMGAR